MNQIEPVAPAPLVQRQDIDQVAWLTLNRPQQYNALSWDMLEALLAEFDRLAADDSVRVVVIGSEGKGMGRNSGW